MMFDFLKKHINRRVPLTDEEFNICTKFFISKKLKKHQFLLNEGDVCRYLGFVNSGCLREYSIDSKGIEHIIQFAIEDWWISDLHSFLSGMPATYNIDALQDSDLFVMVSSETGLPEP